VKVGTADVQFLFKIMNGSRRTLSPTSIEDLDSMFYMLDYILITSPTFYDKLQHE
jgi:hypothetical protein